MWSFLMLNDSYKGFLNMNKIRWCVGKKEGLSLIEPNSDLARAYALKAEEALESIPVNIVKDWKISTAYYTVYFSLYSVLMKLGVRSEIHSCTIEFAKIFLREFFEESELNFMEDALKTRVDSQYYVDRTVPDAMYNALIRGAPEFFVKCKSVLIRLNEKKINGIRDLFQQEIHGR